MYDKNNIKKVLSIAGSDCSGGAGIQADLKTFSSHGVYGMAVITSVVAENTFRVTDYQDVRPDIIEKQIDDIFEDIMPDAVKIGMLSCREIMLSVAKKIKKWKPNNVVVDPVMYAKNGASLMKESDINALISVILPLADLVTPNIPEAEKISGIKIKTFHDMKRSARLIYKSGCRAVVVKGGHDEGNDAIDILFDGNEFYEYCAPRISTKHTHGTGCTFSSSVAANVALGFPLIKALERTKKYISTAIANAIEIGKGHGPIHHFYEMYKKFFSERNDD
ncbi:MAG: bifunctional hydroxymethylpyrimidine kinase/phosphomethylpyrimidine kinase [Candidatus Improbicoccus pseudotrichonymphae]|uniref:Hydroxymethylpyrimidine/phosphomethylpyrimidine kinase n=1 Tax=Candidatus Improbicoccus pseudotrichonymphae TaxID=3033792 RepID=A0AA48I4A4_9FIRM|nr:MAG: bifunctional hydroxymethylpyrimidine kinase/phosphomethylpyrimidine kinase [Candidatus Improbicoccus pseudotrichonymphae]